MAAFQEVLKVKSLLVQKPYLRTNYFENRIEEDIDMKNHFRIRNLKDPINVREAVSIYYFDCLFNDRGTTKNTANVDFKDKNLDNIRFIKNNSMPAVGDDLTSEYYVD